MEIRKLQQELSKETNDHKLLEDCYAILEVHDEHFPKKVKRLEVSGIRWSSSTSRLKALPFL